MLERIIRWRGKKNGINWMPDEYEALNRWGAGIPQDGPLAELDKEMDQHLREAGDPSGDLPTPPRRRKAPLPARLFFWAAGAACTVLVLLAGRRGYSQPVLLGLAGMLVCGWYLSELEKE